MEGKTLREVCADTGVSRRAVQGYEKVGLVSATGKNKYGHLLYDEYSENRIRLIRFYQQIGLSVRDISKIIDAPEDIRKEALQFQLEKLELQYRELGKLINQIRQHLSEL